MYWDMRESKRTEGGVLDRLIVAVLVNAEETFEAALECSVDTPFTVGFLSSPWKRSSPAVLVPGARMGEKLRTERFEELSEGEWRSLTPYEEEWEAGSIDGVELGGERDATPV